MSNHLAFQLRYDQTRAPPESTLGSQNVGEHVVPHVHELDIGGSKKA